MHAAGIRVILTFEVEQATQLTLNRSFSMSLHKCEGRSGVAGSFFLLFKRSIRWHQLQVKLTINVYLSFQDFMLYNKSIAMTPRIRK